MRKWSKRLLPLLLGLSLQTNAEASAPSLEEQTVLAALALNIVRFTTWPPESPASVKPEIDFCVVGGNVAQQSFAGIDGKSVGAKTLRIVNLSRLRNYDRCDVIYISELNQNVLRQLLFEINGRPVLTLGEGGGFAAQGGMVGLNNQDGKIVLHVNLPVARAANLNISARLLKLAKIIGK